MIRLFQIILSLFTDERAATTTFVIQQPVATALSPTAVSSLVPEALIQLATTAVRVVLA